MFIDRAQHGERTLVVHCYNHFSQRDLDEFLELARTSDADVIDTFSKQIRREDSNYFLTKGLLNDLVTLVTSLQNDQDLQLVLIDAHLRPTQERNLEKILGCRVIDRTGLILDVFAKQASSNIGKVQVELAQLQFLATRLKRAWTHLERQKGGIGLRGPGESQLTTDKHLIKQRIAFLKRKITTLQKQRKQNKKRSLNNQIARITLVGYTNAGKSTLHKRLTQSNAMSADKLFSTLDSMSRAIQINNIPMIVTDTIGFIQNLPHQLIESFQATLEDIKDSHMLLHVIDATSPTIYKQIISVNEVLEQLEVADKPRITIYNKIDACEHMTQSLDENTIYLSAHTGDNITELQEKIIHILTQEDISAEWQIMTHLPEHNKFKHKIYELANNVSEVNHQTGVSMLKCQLSRIAFARINTYMETHCADVILKLKS